MPRFVYELELLPGESEEVMSMVCCLSNPKGLGPGQDVRQHYSS